MPAVLRLLAFCAAVLSVALVPATAGAQPATPGDVLRRHLEAGRPDAAIAELAPLARNSPEARMALGFAQFHKAVSGLAAGLYRYGFKTPQNPFLPIFRLPVPLNPTPEPVDYARLRAVYQGALDDLATAAATLDAVPPNDGKLVLDINAIRITFGARAGEPVSLSLAAIINGLSRRPAAPEARWEVAFDRSDALWLQSYAHLISATLEFVMAHDWETTFQATAHLFFAGMKPDPAFSVTNGSAADPTAVLKEQYQGVVDQVAVLHLMHWPAGDRTRMRAVRSHLKTAIATSRKMWASILAETDDDREWLPSPRQSSRAMPGLPITDEMVQGWLGLLDDLDAALDGRKLVGHWRFTKGIDLRMVFEEPRPFDLVLWITGHAAMPYLKDGPILDSQTWAKWNRMFQNSFLAYALYIN